LGDTATGVVNFINFTFSALLGPVFGARLVEMPEGDTSLAFAHYQAGFQTVALRNRRRIEPNGFLEGNRTGEQEDVNQSPLILTEAPPS
jgi:hypothetical protein